MVLETELLTLEESPRTNCWRVTVPFKFKTLMEKDELYLLVGSTGGSLEPDRGKKIKLKRESLTLQMR